MVSFYNPSKRRYKILIEQGAFPTDRYAVTSQLQFHGYDVDDALIQIKPDINQNTISYDNIVKTIQKYGEQIALVLLPAVQYYTGQAFDLKNITKLAKQHGCNIGWDLAHGIGNIPLDLHSSQADFAVWCHYKYLNSGPGAVAGGFVHENNLNKTDLNRFCGWFGHDKSTRFLMPQKFKAIDSAESWQLSLAPVLSTAPILASLELFSQVGYIDRLRAKSIKLTSFLEEQLLLALANKIEIITPTDAKQRGAQLSLKLKERVNLDDLVQNLKKKNIIIDKRAPDVLRVAPTPLYNTFQDCSYFVDSIAECLE